MAENNYSLAELLIVASAEAWRGDGEIMATGIGPLPRIGASLAKVSFSPLLQTTDSETWYTSEPVPPGKRLAEPELEGMANYDRVFSTLWSGKRHAMVGPVQIDRYGQANISVIIRNRNPPCSAPAVFPATRSAIRTVFSSPATTSAPSLAAKSISSAWRAIIRHVIWTASRLPAWICASSSPIFA
jgi:acyl CoA:acetate/3-ketoacid CoA transferase beta subunit